MSDNSSTPSKQNSRYLLGDGTFRFACHSGVACFTQCCHNADMFLYPYDIIRLKKRLDLTSEEFLARHTVIAIRDNPYFPNVMLKMSDKSDNPCSFLSPQGCTVYEDRPYSCRAYPVEPAMFGHAEERMDMVCYVAKQNHCLGHGEGREWTARQWMKDQQMEEYNENNAEWAKIDTLFRKNPLGDNPKASVTMKMVFMASYNVDTFRRFVIDSSFLSRYWVTDERLRIVKENDTSLLLFGFDWIHQIITGRGSLRERKGAAV